jgi:hypothetical protein
MKTVLDNMMKIQVGDVDTESETLCYKGGTVESALRETCHCGQQYCKHEDSPRDYNIAVDALESFMLALAVAGVNVKTPAFSEALETTLDKMAQMYDS